MGSQVRFLVAFILLSGLVNGQSFSWAKRAGLWAFDLGYGIATDNAGNVYISGKYEMNAKFGETTVSCAGNHDIYLAKYGSSGDLKWVRTAGGPYGDYAHAMACDANGNVYITGEMESTVSFGPGVSLTSNGDNDVFIAKYNTSGVLVWAKKMGGGSKSDKGLGLSLSGSGVFITGKFVGTARFAGTTTLTSSGGADIFVARYSTDGVFQWAKKAGGSGDDEGYAISNDPAGNVYVTGYFSGTAAFSGQYVTSKGGTDIFLAKYSSSGGIVWVRKAGGTANDYGMGVKVNGSYQAFLTGGFRVKSTFGTYTLNASGGNADIFVGRYDSNGNASWVRKAGGTLNDYGRAIALDAASNVYITGNYGFTAAFSNTSITASDSTDIYFASYDQAGNFRWVLKAGGPLDKLDPGRYNEMGLSIATDSYGNVVGSGAYRSSTSFGSVTLQPWSHTDIYIVKITQGSSMKAMEMARPAVVPADSATFCSGGSVWLKTAADSSCGYQWLKDGAVLEDATGWTFKAQQPGKYSVLVIRGEDTLESAATIVIVTDRIPAAVRAAPGKFCLDSSNVLMAATGDDYQYQWKRNGRTIRGSNTPTFVPERDGDYQVRIVQGSCFEWSAPFKVVMESCGRDSAAKVTAEAAEVKEDSLLVHIYPNPNSGLFTLELNLRNAVPARVHVDVFDATGQPVFHDCVTAGAAGLHRQIELDRAAPAGVYFLRVAAGESVETQRMLLLR